MSHGIAALYKILKDDTRQKIVILLNEKGSLSYTELMADLGIDSTGLLNYHLKVLNGLLEKADNGQYGLSEKGKLASRLLTEFPEQDPTARRIWQKRIFLVLLLSQVSYLSITLTFYVLGLVDFYRLVVAISYFTMATVVVYFGYRMQRKIPLSGSKEEKSRMRIGYTVGGVLVGLVGFFFLAGFLLRALQEITGQPLLHTIFWTDLYLGFSLLLAPAIGGVVGYYFGKQKDFQKPKWAIWIDSHI